MSDLIAVTGNLTSAPERRELSNGVVMATFGLASTERRLENGTWTDVHTNYYDVAVFRRLAEHALASLQRGQRVIVMGKLKVRKWDSNGHSGVTVDLEASALGPDLKFGVASFVRDAAATSSSAAPQVGAGAQSGPAPQVGADAWATPGEAARALDSRPPLEAVEARTAPVPAEDAAGAPPVDAPELVAAGAWGDDPTPF